MAKVDWITWKTNTDEIINIEKVNNLLDKDIADLNNIIDNVYDNIKSEVDKGGLNSDSLSLNGESPSNVMANNILNNITEIRTIINNLSNKMSNQVLEQKKIEKEQLVTTIEEKIKEQERILENTKLLRNRISAGSDVVNMNDVNNVISSTKEKLEMLYDRLEKAKAI